MIFVWRSVIIERRRRAKLGEEKTNRMVVRQPLTDASFNRESNRKNKPIKRLKTGDLSGRRNILTKRSQIIEHLRGFCYFETENEPKSADSRSNVAPSASLAMTMQNTNENYQTKPNYPAFI